MRSGFVALLFTTALTFAPTLAAGGGAFGDDKFRQLEEILPTPNDVRSPSGAPGPKYWQQRADYVIRVELDDVERSIRGEEKIHYVNHSPHTLPYLWIQLDNNIFHPQSHSTLSNPAPAFGKGEDAKIDYDTFRTLNALETFDGSVQLEKVRDGKGNALDYTVVGTTMRIDLPRPLEPKASFDLEIHWQARFRRTPRCGSPAFSAAASVSG